MSDFLAPSVQRIIQLLENLLSHPQGLTLKDLLAESDSSRSSLFITLNTLKSLGYVEQAEKRGRYCAGPRLLAWQGSASPTLATDLLTAFYHEAEMSGLEETLALAVPTAEVTTLILGQAESPREVRSVFTVGQPLHATSASGQLFQFPIAPVIREQGFSQQERGDAVDVAFPICRDGVVPHAALVLSAPAFRWDETAAGYALPALREMAARLSYRLGAPLYAPWRAESPLEFGETLLLTEAQLAAVLKSPWTARLACIRPDGMPHVVPVWHEWDGYAFHVLAWKGSRWADYLLANSQVSLTVDEPWPPLRRVSAKGTAQSEYAAGDPLLTSLLARLSRRYLGKNLAMSLIPQVEHSFVIIPSTLRGWQGIS